VVKTCWRGSRWFPGDVLFLQNIAHDHPSIAVPVVLLELSA